MSSDHCHALILQITNYKNNTTAINLFNYPWKVTVEGERRDIGGQVIMTDTSTWPRSSSRLVMATLSRPRCRLVMATLCSYSAYPGGDEP